MLKLKMNRGGDDLLKYYERMVNIGCFSRTELAEALHLCDATTATLLQQYQKKGYIQRVRHDLYVVISIENKQPVLSRYGIGSRIFPDACISHHSAFEVYGYANQVFYEVYVMTNSRFKDFEYDGITYRRVAPKGTVQKETVRGVRVAGIEQTVIDSINAVDKIGGLEELIRCLSLIPSLDEEKLLLALAEYKNGFLYQKTGFLLEQFRAELSLSDAFFGVCEGCISKSDRYLTKEHAGFVYHPKWRLIAPKDINRIVNKGVEHYAEA